jgi:hypothetical protein
MATSSSSTCRGGGRTNVTGMPYFSAGDSCSAFAVSTRLTFGCKYGAAASRKHRPLSISTKISL